MSSLGYEVIICSNILNMITRPWARKHFVSLDYTFDYKPYSTWYETSPTHIPCWYPCHTHVNTDTAPFIPSPGNIGISQGLIISTLTLFSISIK